MSADNSAAQRADKRGLPGAGLAKGLATTLKTMTHRSVTAQYPDVKPELPPRTRGVIALLEENCTSCMLCARECPDWCIYIDSHKEVVPATEPGQRDRTRNVLDRFAIDFSLCMYCGICIEVCPFDALFWSPEFEYAEFDILDLLHEKDRLRDWMWTVPAPPAPAANAEPPKEIAAAQKAVEKQAVAEAKAAADRAATPPPKKSAQPKPPAPAPEADTREIPKVTGPDALKDTTELPAVETTQPTPRAQGANESELSAALTAEIAAAEAAGGENEKSTAAEPEGEPERAAEAEPEATSEASTVEPEPAPKPSTRRPRKTAASKTTAAKTAESKTAKSAASKSTAKTTPRRPRKTAAPDTPPDSAAGTDPSAAPKPKPKRPRKTAAPSEPPPGADSGKSDSSKSDSSSDTPGPGPDTPGAAG
jgi:NADH-quinone oxidoreductase subunit I